MQTAHIHIHLAVTPEVAAKFDALADEWRLKRPWALERMVNKEYKALIAKRAQSPQPAQDAKE